MSNAVAKVIELTSASPNRIEDAVENVIQRADAPRDPVEGGWGQDIDKHLARRHHDVGHILAVDDVGEGQLPIDADVNRSASNCTGKGRKVTDRRQGWEVQAAQ